MTKGVFTLVPIGGAIAGQLIINRQWNQIFHWRWIVALVLISVFISPELYSLWVQFDSHPEKMINNETNVSGIKFFLWESQFGRFTRTGIVKSQAVNDPGFFLHTLLWAFLPWCLVMYAALFTRIRKGIKKRVTDYTEWFTISGSLFSLLLFSTSQKQLPYYTNIIFPMLAILCAHFIREQMQSNRRVFSVIQTVIIVLMTALAAALFLLYKPAYHIAALMLIVALVLLLVFLAPLLKTARQLLPWLRSGLAAIILSFFLNLIFYPDLLRYQSGNEAAFYINKNFPGTPAGHFDLYVPCADFYLNEKFIETSPDSVRNGEFARNGILFLSEKNLKQLEETGVRFELLKEFPDFHITMLHPKFLNPKTRERVLQKTFLVKLQ